MNRAPKKARKSGQFSGSVGSQPAPMAPVTFVDTSNHTRVSPPRRWPEIYEFISAAKPSNRPPLVAVRDSDEGFSEIDIYDDELVKTQRSEIYKIASRPTILPITDVVQWVATHVDFRASII